MAYLRMMMQPKETQKMEIPYLGKIMKPERIYEDQVKRHPLLTEKLDNVESVVNVLLPTLQVQKEE